MKQGSKSQPSEEADEPKDRSDSPKPTFASPSVEPGPSRRVEQLALTNEEPRKIEQQISSPAGNYFSV